MIAFGVRACSDLRAWSSVDGCSALGRLMAAEDAHLGVQDSSDVSALLREADELQFQMDGVDVVEPMDEAAIAELLLSTDTGGDDGLPAGHTAVSPGVTETAIA